MALARGALLRRGDLGRGWSVQSAPPHKVPSLTCPRFNPRVSRSIEIGSAASPTFQASRSGPFVSEIAHVYATASQETAVWHAIARPGLLRCVADSLRRSGAHGVRFRATRRRLLSLPALPAPTHGYRVSGTASLAYQTIDVYLDMLLVGHGQSVAAIVLSSFEQPPSRRLELRLARIVGHRLSG